MIRTSPSGFSIIKRGKKWIANESKDFGKWIIYHKNPEFLAKFQKELNILVEKGKVRQIKFVNVKELNKMGKNFLPKRKESFLCIYCWKKEKLRVKNLLKKIGLKPKRWKSNFQTIIDWLPGGKLYEEMKRGLPKAEFERGKKEFVNIKYWNFIKKKLKNYLPKTKYKRLEHKVLKVLSKNEC